MSKLTYGSTFHFQNLYDVPRGDYLDLNNAINDQEYLVSTTSSTARDGQSGTWKIESAKSGQGTEIKVGDIVKIRSESRDKNIYLCAIAYAPDPGSWATIQAVSNRISTDESLQWEIYVPNGVKGDALEESSTFYFLNQGQQAYLGVYGGGAAGTSNALYGLWGYKKFSAIPQLQWRAIVASSAPAPAPTPKPTPDLQKSRQYSCDVPANTTIYISAINNTNKLVRKVLVQIDGKEAAPILLPTSGAGLVQTYKSGSTGKNSISILVEDSQGGQLTLGWYSPVTLGDGTFVNIGAEKDYQNETGFSDVVVSVYWDKSNK
jgi:hypothetical protein